MKQILIATMILANNAFNTQAQQLDFATIKLAQSQLNDVMEIIDTTILVTKLNQVKLDYTQNPTEINKVKLGIIYHETALNLTFLAKSNYKGYAQKSVDLLSQLEESNTTTKVFLPFIASYRASALALVGAETKKLKLVGKAFKLFEQAVIKYAEISYMPQFLRGSVAENLPWFFFSKRKLAKKDFQSIIEKYKQNPQYAPHKIMSFTYWTWANHHKQKKYRTATLACLNKAIYLDPNYQAGRKRAEELKQILGK